MVAKSILKIITTIVAGGAVATTTVVYLATSKSSLPLNQALSNSIHSNLIEQKENISLLNQLKSLLGEASTDYEKLAPLYDSEKIKSYALSSKQQLDEINKQINLVINYAKNQSPNNQKELSQLAQSTQNQIAKFLDELFEKDINNSVSTQKQIDALIKTIESKIEGLEISMNLTKLEEKFAKTNLASSISLFQGFSNKFQILKINELTEDQVYVSNLKKFLEIFQNSPSNNQEINFENYKSKIKSLGNDVLKNLVQNELSFSYLDSKIKQWNTVWTKIQNLKTKLQDQNLGWLVKFVEENNKKAEYENILNNALINKKWSDFSAFFIKQSDSSWTINEEKLYSLTSEDLDYWKNDTDNKLINLKLAILKNKLTKTIESFTLFQNLLNISAEENKDTLKTASLESISSEFPLSFDKFSALFIVSNGSHTLNSAKLNEITDPIFQKLTQLDFDQFDLFTKRSIVKNKLSKASLIKILQIIENFRVFQTAELTSTLSSITWPSAGSYADLLSFYLTINGIIQFDENELQTKSDTELTPWIEWNESSFETIVKASDEYKKSQLFEKLTKLQPSLESVFLWIADGNDNVNYVKPGIEEKLPESSDLSYDDLAAFYFSVDDTGDAYLKKDVINGLNSETLEKWSSLDIAPITEVIKNQKTSIEINPIAQTPAWDDLIELEVLKNSLKDSGALSSNDEYLWEASLLRKQKRTKVSLIWFFQFKNNFVKLKITLDFTDGLNWTDQKPTLRFFLDSSTFEEIDSYVSKDPEKITDINKKRKNNQQTKIMSINGPEDYKFSMYLTERLTSLIKKDFFDIDSGS